VALHDHGRFPGPPFKRDCVFGSADPAPNVLDVQVDASSDASDHQAAMVELAESGIDCAVGRLDENGATLAAAAPLAVAASSGWAPKGPASVLPRCAS
jgi:hypothetical protein